MAEPWRVKYAESDCLSLALSSFSVCLHLYPHFLSVSISILIFCLSPSLSSFSFCLHLYPYYLSVSVFFFIFCLSPYKSSFFVCLQKRERHTENKDRDGDRQISPPFTPRPLTPVHFKVSPLRWLPSKSATEPPKKFARTWVCSD